MSSTQSNEVISAQRWAGTLFFFSGLTGLIYEILWTRRLSLTFGHSVLAVSTVVTAYMAGLALGSWFGGRWGDRQAAHRSSDWFIRAYGVLEAGIGVWALLSLFLLSLVEKAYLWLAGAGFEGLRLYLMLLLLSMIVLLPPTAAMGATLPLVTNLFRDSPKSLGINLSRLYATNTFGAVVGAGMAGFVLLPWLGLKLSVVCAALINLTIGAFALRLKIPQERVEAAPSVPRQAGGKGQLFLPLVFGLAGFASMLFQLSWTRGLAICLGSSVYAFSSILVWFLLGIAGGSALYVRLFRSRVATLGDLGRLCIGIGLTGTLSVWMLGRMPLIFSDLFPRLPESPLAPFLLNFGLIAALLLPPTLLMGLAFPLVSELYHRQGGRLGGTIGTVYGSNTFGCIAGSFLGGFVCLPSLGVQNTIELAASCNLLGALLCFANAPGPARVRFAWVSVALLLMGVNRLQPRWDQGVLMSGLVIRPPALEKKPVPRFFIPPTFALDGISCSVGMFVADASTLFMRVNGKVDASRGVLDRQTSICIPLLTLLYQPEPRHVGIIGLGSGMTLGTVASTPSVERAECAELEPAVVECDRYWAPFNRQALKNPKSRVFERDGRAFILGSREKFDAVISIPSNPWIAGIGNLYTRDYFERAREQLSEHGVYLQWCNIYAVSKADLMLVLHTFFSAYPYGAIWTTGGDIVMVGSPNPLRPDMGKLLDFYAKDATLRHQLAELSIYTPGEFLGQYVCDREEVMPLVARAGQNLDDLPVLEYSAPLSLYRQNGSSNRAWIREVMQASRPLPLLKDPVLGEAGAWGRMSLLSMITNLPSRWSRSADGQFFQLLQSASDQELERKAQDFFRTTPCTRGRIEFAKRSFNLGRYEDTLAWIPEESMAQGTEAERYAAFFYRGLALYNLGRFAQAVPELRATLQLEPTSDIASALALACFSVEQNAEAEAAARKSLQLNPYDPRAHFVMGQLALVRGDVVTALQAFRQSSQISPNFFEAWLMRGQIATSLKLWDEARECFTWVSRGNPSQPQLKQLIEKAVAENADLRDLLQQLP